jgi:ribosomal protein S18 acetylase RimI-like enzyme
MAIVLRPLEQRDVLKALSLFQKLESEMAEVSFTEVLEEEQICQWITNEQTFVYVAADGDLVLAVIRAKRENPDRPHAVVLTVAVDYQFRGQNIAKDLTLFCLDQIKEQGVDIARAYIYSNNYASVCTILSCGFVSAGSVHRHHYDERQKRYVDDLIFHKVLGH